MAKPMRPLIVLFFMSQTLSAQSLPAVRAAVTRALPVLQRSAGEFVAKRACVSCHHNILTILSLDVAKSRGFEIDASVLRAVEDKTFRELRSANALDNAIQAATLNDPTPNDTSGAEAQPAGGVRVRNSPLVLASMTGDLENIKLLLENGARPEEKALAEAVTFGYPDVVRALIQAGADAGIVENSGINLLHWATIANRPQLIAPLFEAGLPIDARDDNGFTPLMYAATIDFGNSEVLTALLKAGADKKIPNRRGRTPLAQARHLRLSHLEPALR